MDSHFLPLFVALPLLGAFLTPLLSKLTQELADIIGSTVGALLVSVSCYGLFAQLGSSEALVYWTGNWRFFGIAMVYDALTALVVLVINVVGFCALLYSVRYISHYTARWKFYTLFLLMLAGLNGLAISGDLFNMFVFIEIAAVASYALVAFGTEAEELEAGFKYMVLGEVGGMAILFSIALIYSQTSTLNLAQISKALPFGTPFFWFVLATLLIGFAIKMAMVPFHAWLPDAHPSAPAPVSAMLSGVFIKVVGVYAMARLVFNVFGLSREATPAFFNLLIGFGILSMIAGGLVAYSQTDYKRLLAYSSISQMGYILIGLGIGNAWAVAGALFHLLAHAMGKGLLFLVSGSVEAQTGTRNIDQLKGLERTMPLTAWSHVLGSLSLAGVPPFAGFFSKLFIIVGALQARMYWLAVLAALFSAVTLAYLTKVVNKAFFSRDNEEPVRAHEAGGTMAIAVVILILLSVLTGIFFVPVLDGIVRPAADVLLKGAGYAGAMLGVL